MSCVPSMSAYVATQTCQHDEKLPTTQFNQPIDQSSKERKSFWEWSKFIFLGHDGVGLATSDIVQKGQKIDNKPEALDLWSRVRHLSGSSTTSNEGDPQPSPGFPTVDR